MTHVREGRKPRIAIIGAGAAGLCMAIRLRKAGYDDVIIFEKSENVGGTWHDNRYPGAGCDIPSHLYCFSFEPNPLWSRKFSLQPEIERYFHHCAEKYEVYSLIRFGTEIARARFDESTGQWDLVTTSGEQITVDVLVSGTGQLNRPMIPRLAGVDAFEGEAFHSARWNEDAAIEGRDVAIVGSGASAIQIIPELAKKARKLTVFQRSPSYVVRRGDRRYRSFEKWIFQNVPFALWLYRALIYWSLELRFVALFPGTLANEVFRFMALSYLDTVEDLELKKKLTPDYAPGCKRILISDEFYEAVSRPNVVLVTSGIEHLGAREIVSRDGEAHPADVLVYATGFSSTSFLAPIDIRGKGGMRLAEAWKEGAEAYWGIAVAGFPNLFLLYGPNTNLGHNSIMFMIECQVHFALRCIEELDRRGARFVDVRPEAMRVHNDMLQRELGRTAWASGCHNWYKTDAGKITNNWSSFTARYWLATREPRWGEIELHL